MFQIITFAFIVSHYSKKVNKKILTAFGTTGDTKNFGKTQFTILGQTADDLNELKKSMESLGYGKLDFTNLGTFGKTSSGNITAFFKAIMQGSSDTAAQLKVDTESIQKYIDEYSLNGLDAAKKKYDEFMSDASSQAKLYVQQTNAAALSTDAFAESQTRLAKISNSVVGGLKDIGAAIASAGLTLIASAAINFVVKTIYEEVTAMERMRDAGTEASKAVDSNAQSISDYISQISTLKESLDSGTLSENEAYDARKQLLSIQDSIISKYGEEAAGVDLLNGSLQAQIDKLNEIANSDMRDWLSDNSEAIVDAQNKMSANNEYMSQYLGTLDESDLSEVNKLVSKYSSKGLSLENTSDGLVLKVTTDMTDAKEVLANLNDDIKNSGALSENTAAILEHSIKLASQDVESGLNTYQSYVDKASEYQIQTNDHYRKLYEDLKDASEKYSEAVAKDDAKAIEDALKVSRSAIEAFNNDAFDQATLTTSDNQFIKQYMQAQADQLDESTKLKAAQIGLNAVIKDGSAALTDYLNITEEDAKRTVDTIKSSVQSLNGLDDLDLVDIGSLENAGTEITAYTKEQVQAYDNMKSAADKLGISMSDLIDILVKAGLVTGESIKYTNEFTTNALSAATNATKAISLVTAAMQSQSTTAGVSSDSYSELIKEHGEYAAALDFENGYVKLNTDMAKKITQAKIDEAEANIKLAYSQNQMKYSQVKADLEALNTAVQQNGKLEGENAEQVEKARTELEAQSKQLRENCRNLQMQYSLLVQNSGAYQDWVNAQNATEFGDMYDSIINAKKAIAEGLKNGKIGTEKFKAAVELTIPEDYQGDIAKYMKRLNRYFKQASDGSADASGLNNFLKDSIKAGLMSKDAKDQITIAANKTTKDFADALHLSMEDVQSIWGELQEYGWEFDWGSLLGNPVDNLRMQIDDIQDQMDALGEDAENSPIWQALNEQLTDLQEKLKETFTGMDSSEINQTIDEIIEEAKKANGQLTDSQADALYEMGRVQNMYDLKEAQDKLTEAQKEYNDAVQSGTNYSDMSGVATELQDAQDQVTKLTQAKEKLGEPTPVEIQTFAVKYAAGEIDGIQHDAKETTEMLANIGCSVDTTQAQSEIETQNQMADEFRNKLDNVPVTLDTSTCETKISTVSKALDGLKKDIPVTLNFGIKGTLITGVANGLSYSRGGGSSKTKGTGHAAGTPNASGGKTLVGEIGNELVVNPHTGKWYTVGDNGAEFVNLPHGAIVFDHEKTQKLLNNGFVGSWGEALAGGTAMGAGSPGIGSYVGTAGNNYLPGKNPLVKSTYKATTASTKATKDNSKALEENKKALEKQKTALEKQKTALEKESNKLKIYGQAALDEIEKREKAINKEKDAKDKAWDAEKKQLEDKKQALQDANDEEDRAIKLAELRDALAKAKANRTVRIYNENQGFIWAADQEAVNDAQTSLDDQQRDWRREDAIKAVEDEIDKIDELKDAYAEQIDAEIKKLDDLKDKWNEVMGLIGTDWDDYQAQLAAAAHFNDMTFDGMTGDLVGYKNDVLASMREIGGVTDQIDSITESIEKLEEAISDAKDAASGGGSGSGGGTALGLGTADATDVDTGLFDELSASVQETFDKLTELQNKYVELGDDTESLNEKQLGLVDTMAGLTVGSAAHKQAVEELADAQKQNSENTKQMDDIYTEYMDIVTKSTDLTFKQKQALIDSMLETVDSYSSGYTTINELMQAYAGNVISNTNLTLEQRAVQLDNLTEFAGQYGSDYANIATVLEDSVIALAENTELTNAERQAQMDNISALADHYGVSKDTIVQHLISVAAQEAIAKDSTENTHSAMQNAVLAACQAMNASYDSTISKIGEMVQAYKQAQVEMMKADAEAAVKKDFAHTMPLGAIGNHADRIRWNTAVGVEGHATGVLNAATTHMAITDEKGPEIKMRKPSAGQYSLIERGGSVIPAEPSTNLWKFGLDPESFIAQHMSQRSIKSVEITQPNVGSGVTVSVGDIQMYGVNDVESFGRVIHDRVSGIFAQEFSKR